MHPRHTGYRSRVLERGLKQLGPNPVAALTWGHVHAPDVSLVRGLHVPISHEAHRADQSGLERAQDHPVRPLPEMIAHGLRRGGEIVLGRCAKGERRVLEALPPEGDVGLGIRVPQRPDHPRRAGHQRPGQTCLACARLTSRPTSTTTPPVAGFTRIVSHSFRVFSSTCARSSAVSGA